LRPIVKNNLQALLVFILLTLTITGCSHDEDKILNDANYLYCQRHLLNQSSESLWNNVSRHLDINLPNDMDTSTRKRMIELRNAPILKSFNAYKHLPDSVKIIVDKAEIADKKLVDEIAEISFSIDSLEIRKLRFLSKINQASERAQLFLVKYNQAFTSPCKPALK